MSFKSPKAKLRERLEASERGVVSVEFVILFPLIMLIIVALIEGGHLWHIKHTITNASREGARAAIVYHNPYDPTDNCPDGVQCRAKTAVNNYLNQFLPSGFWQVTVDPVPATYPQGTQNRDVTVTVTIPNGALLILDKIVPAFQNISIQAETTMRLE